MKFILFTKTDWSEPPRLRHQLARLLSNAGHEIIFFERPMFFWQKIIANKSESNNILLKRSRQLIHHKLRFHPLFHLTNARYEKRSILRSLSHINSDDVIINFNYDYFFLKDLFPENRIITIINDNFWSRAIFGWEQPLEWALKRTCNSSCHVLTVSPPLMKIINNYCTPHLFLPWINNSNLNPVKPTTHRTELLYWGFIGDRIDWPRIFSLAKFISDNQLDFTLVFIGPYNSNDKNIKYLVSFSCVVLSGAISFDKLNFTKTLAIFIPYKSRSKENDAIYIPNKLLQLLTKGLPVIITGMPYFVEANFIFRLPEINEEIPEFFEYLTNNIERFQPEIFSFLAKNTTNLRLRQFMSYVNLSHQNTVL